MVGESGFNQSRPSSSNGLAPFWGRRGYTNAIGDASEGGSEVIWELADRPLVLVEAGVKPSNLAFPGATPQPVGEWRILLVQ